MLLKNFLSMFINKDNKEDPTPCYVTDSRYYHTWTSKNDNNFFIGNICDIPQELLQRNFDKWDMIGNYIVFVLK